MKKLSSVFALLCIMVLTGCTKEGTPIDLTGTTWTGTSSKGYSTSLQNTHEEYTYKLHFLTATTATLNISLYHRWTSNRSWWHDGSGTQNFSYNLTYAYVLEPGASTGEGVMTDGKSFVKEFTVTNRTLSFEYSSMTVDLVKQ